MRFFFSLDSFGFLFHACFDAELLSFLLQSLVCSCDFNQIQCMFSRNQARTVLKSAQKMPIIYLYMYEICDRMKTQEHKYRIKIITNQMRAVF